MINKAIGIFLIVFFLTGNAFALTVEQAYEAIPHRRTVFDQGQAKMTLEEKKFFIEFYELVDLAIVNRVDMLIYLLNDGRQGSVASDYGKILRRLEMLSVPKKLVKAHSLVVLAIKDQRDFLFNWKTKRMGRDVNVASDSTVRRANKNLIAAYNLFMKAYPKEGNHNKQAFFDYLCALDFI